MSGGVDSSVAAALLQQQGCQVTGMMLRLWSEPGREDSNRCCTPDAQSLARRVAARLDIPFYVVDARDIFRRTVVQYFLDSYASGLTPNPCLLCNRVIRWEFLLDHALALGADYMATGHYVRMENEGGRMELLRGVDPAKDQSYVLHMLTQEKLARALFPLGEYPKSEVRRLAQEFDLPVAQRADSQDLCFLAGEDYRLFIQRHASETLRPGEIVNTAGKVLGSHSGLANYTIGQRKGLGLTTLEPHYVLGKDAASNRLVVGLADELGGYDLVAREVNWISGQPPDAPFRAQVKTRYTAHPAWAEVTSLEDGSGVRVRFDEPQRDLTPGQAAVFYDGDILLGGGMII